MKRPLILMIIFLLVAIAAKNEVTIEKVCAPQYVAPEEDISSLKTESAIVRMIDF